MIKKTVMIIIFIVTFSTYSYAKNVTIKMPSFNVKLNNDIINNEYREYPLITYNDITYFPMTYDDSRFLGIISSWSNEKGLEIFTDNSYGSLNEVYKDYKNKTVDTASVVDFDVYVNGQKVNTAKEEYPLLLYRDVTYFPMTYKFVFENFGWQTSFSNDKGLEVNSNNLYVEMVDAESFIYNLGNNFTYFKNNYYIIENTKKVYKIDKNTNEKILLFDLLNDDYDMPIILDIIEDKLYIKYYSGSAGMGGFVHYEILDNDTILKRDDLYHTFYLSENLYYKSTMNNLNIYYNNDGIQYAIENLQQNETNINFLKIPESNIVVGENIFLLTYNNDIIKINYIDKSIKIINSNIKASRYYILNNKIYFTNVEDNKLYVMDLDGNNVLKISDTKIKEITSNGTKLYYILEGKEKMGIFDTESKEEEIITLNLKLDEFNFLVNDNYIYFILYNDPTYTIRVLKNEKDNYYEVIKITDPLYSYDRSNFKTYYDILDDGIIYINRKNQKLIKIKFD